MKITIITVTYNSQQSVENAIASVLGQSVLRQEQAGSLAAGAHQEQACSLTAGAHQAQACSLTAGTHQEQASSLTEPDGSREAPGEPETVLLEYLIIDGSSKDATVTQAESYRPAFEKAGVEYRIVSEPDKGIYDAMNKGIALATGDIIGILNSDDWYEPDTLETVLRTFRETTCDLMFANIRMHKTDGATFVKKARQRKFQTSRDWNHPTTFVKAALYKQHPFANLGIHDDYGFYLNMRKLGAKIVTVDKVLANFRLGGASNHKSLKEAFKRIKDRYRYCYRINGYSRWYLVECVAIEAAKMILG